MHDVPSASHAMPFNPPSMTGEPPNEGNAGRLGADQFIPPSVVLNWTLDKKIY